MGLRKCCVGGCNSTSKTHRLFSIPKNDKMRLLWLSFLVVTNPLLSGLTKDQLIERRVCSLHFDKYQFDRNGNRILHGYPCLFSEEEIRHGIPLGLQGHLEHNYCSPELPNDSDEDCVMEIIEGDHTYSSLTEEPKDQPNTSSAKPVLCPVKEPMEVEVEALPCSITEKRFDQTVQSEKPMEIEITENRTIVSGDKRADKMEITEIAEITTRKTVSRKSKAKQIVVTAIQPVLQKCKCHVKRLKQVSAGIDSTTPFMTRFEHAQDLIKNSLLMKNINKLSKFARMFIVMQLNLAGKNKRALRFSIEEKVLSLTLLKESPKGYRILQSIFRLPSRRTLNRLAEKIVFDIGINENMFAILKKQASKWDLKKKLCSIVFDEVALTPHLTYVESQDKIKGFKDVGERPEMKFCDHALVFMIRGVCSSWRQAIAYYLVEGTISAADLRRILKDIILKVAESGLTPVALICDQGSTFRSTMKTLKNDTERESILRGEHYDGRIEISGQKLDVIYDPPHLLKGIRNNFLTKDLIFKGQTASWDDILTVYDLDCQLGHTKNLPKLTDQHVVPEKIKKMKVSAATQTLSARTSAMLHYTSKFKTLQNGTTVSKTMKTTAEAVEFFDALFDSVNGSKGSSKKGKLRGPIKAGCKQFAFWREAKDILKSIKFIDATSKKSVRCKKSFLVRVPSIDGWTETIRSFERISTDLFEKFGVDYFYPRNLNQDPLENFFGRIRALNYRNVNPDTYTFVNSFKSLLISNIMGPHSMYSNCEDDKGESVVDFLLLLNKNSKKQTQTSNEKENIDPQCAEPQFAQEAQDFSEALNDVIKEKMRVHSSAYTAGYLCRKLSKKFNCKDCKETYISQEIDNTHEMITHREYKGLKNRRLAYPSKILLITYRELSNLIHAYLNKYAHLDEIMTNLKNIALKWHDFGWLGCISHRQDVQFFFVKLIIRLHVHNWVNIINKILRGAVGEKYVVKMRAPQKLALLKYKAHKLRNKKK